MSGNLYWNEKLTIKLSRAAIVVLGRKFSASAFQNEYNEFADWGAAAQEGIDELCCALEVESVFAPESQSEDFWENAEKALLERTK